MNPLLATSDPFNWNVFIQFLVAALVAWNTWRLEQRAKTSKQERETLNRVDAGVAEVQKQTNGLTEKLVTSEKAASKAEGKVEERSEVAERVIVAQAVEDKKGSQRIQMPP